MDAILNTCLLCGRVDNPLLDGICRDCKANPPKPKQVPVAAAASVQAVAAPVASSAAIGTPAQVAGAWTASFVASDSAELSSAGTNGEPIRRKGLIDPDDLPTIDH